MVKQKLKINLFDLFAIFIVLALGLVLFIGHKNQTYLGSHDVIAEIHITDDSSMIKSALPFIKNNAEVYYGGTKYMVKTISHSSTNNSESLSITVEGRGDINPGKSIFEGQRIYINQKTELRGDYSLQGYITNFYYEN